MAERYRKVSVVGSGTFGKVWLVRHHSTGRRHIIKEVTVAGITEKAREQALTEVSVLARCRHVNVIRYREAFIQDQLLNIVMAYADGGDLHARIEKQNGSHFPEPVIVDWFVQICFALHYIHSLHIVHRDLKTHNIFLSGANLIKVGDFGIARILGSTKDHAMTAIGTPYYLSPEICQQKPYNQKSDMWALGCVLYELCCLTHPFDGQNMAALVIHILNGAYTPIPSHYSALLEDLVAVLLREHAESRPSASQVLRVPALQQYVSSHVTGPVKTPKRAETPPASVMTPTARRSAEKENVFPKSEPQRSRRSSPHLTPPSSEPAAMWARNHNSADNHPKRTVNKDRSPLERPAPAISLYKQVLRYAHKNSPELSSPEVSPTAPSEALPPRECSPPIAAKTYIVRKWRGEPAKPSRLNHYHRSPKRKPIAAGACVLVSPLAMARPSCAPCLRTHLPSPTNDDVITRQLNSRDDEMDTEIDSLSNDGANEVEAKEPARKGTEYATKNTAPIVACKPVVSSEVGGAAKPEPTAHQIRHDVKSAPREVPAFDELKLCELLYDNFCSDQNATYPLMEKLRCNLENDLGLEELHEMRMLVQGSLLRGAAFPKVVSNLRVEVRHALPYVLQLLQLEAITDM